MGGSDKLNNRLPFFGFFYRFSFKTDRGVDLHTFSDVSVLTGFDTDTGYRNFFRFSWKSIVESIGIR